MPIAPGWGTATDTAIRVYRNAGAPTNGTSGTLAGSAPPGALLLDTTNAVLYINGNTQLSPTWNVAVSSVPTELTDLATAIPTAAVASVASADAVAAAGGTPTAAEFLATVTLANELKAQLNALLTRLRTAGIVTP